MTRFVALAALTLAALLDTGCARTPQRQLDLKAYEEIDIEKGRLESYPPVLRDAIVAYNDGEYATAAAKFYDVLQDQGLRATHISVQYYLAECLDRLGLYQSAMTELANLLFKPSDIETYTAAALKKLLALTQITRNERFIFQVLVSVPIDKFPGAFRNELVYMRGRYFYYERQYDKALEELEKVEKTSAFYAKSLYVKAVVHVIQKDYPLAQRTFREIEALPTTYSDFGEASKVKEMTKLAIGQFLYKAGYDAPTPEQRRRYMLEAIKSYDTVDRETQSWVQALFQKTWASMLIGNNATALGTVHTLRSPFFAEQFLPELGLIESITWFKLCKYDVTKESIDGFVGRYQPMLDSVKAYLDANRQADPERTYLDVLFQYKYRMGFSDPAAAETVGDYSAAFGAVDSEKTRDYIDSFRRVLAGGEAESEFKARLLPLPVLTNVLVNDRAFRDAHSSVLSVRRELLRLRSLPAAFQQSGVGGRYGTTLDRLLTAGQRQAGRAAVETLQRTGEYLNELIGSARTIQFELADAERQRAEDLEKFGISEQQFVRDREAVEAANYIEAVASDEYYWPFQGEYWKDELGYYLYTVITECDQGR